jgi:hypothetical protein
LGVHEVRSRLITYLRFPPTITAGFRSLEGADVEGKDIPLGVMASSQHLLGGIDIQIAILVAAGPRIPGCMRSLVRFEGVVPSR